VSVRINNVGAFIRMLKQLHESCQTINIIIDVKELAIEASSVAGISTYKFTLLYNEKDVCSLLGVKPSCRRVSLKEFIPLLQLPKGKPDFLNLSRCRIWIYRSSFCWKDWH
jgi:hypothetical protein